MKNINKCGITRNISLKLTSLFLMLIFSISFFGIFIEMPVAYAVDEYDGLREKYKFFLTGYNFSNPYSTTDPDITLFIDNLDTDASEVWSTMNSNGVWDDLYTGSATDSLPIGKMYYNLYVLTLALNTYGSYYYNNSTLLSDIITGLDYLYANRYNENIIWYDNYYIWEFSVPRHLTNIMTLLYDELTSTQISNYIAGIDHFCVSLKYNLNNHEQTGSNLSEKCKYQILRGIIGKNSAKIQEASDTMDELFIYQTQEADNLYDGLYIDGSAKYHGYYPYAGGYNATCYSMVVNVLSLLVDSTWENDSEYKSNTYDWYDIVFSKNMIDDNFIRSRTGRNIARYPQGVSVKGDAFIIVRALLEQIEDTSNPYISEHKSAIKYYLQSDYDVYLKTAPSIWYIIKAKEIINDSSISTGSGITGMYLTYNEDRAIKRTSDWIFDIAMHSSRIKNYEVNNLENLKGWYSADGMTYLYTDSTDYLYNYAQTVDAHRLPGITVDRDTTRSTDNINGLKSTKDFVGGVTLDGLYSTVTMDFLQHNYSNMDVSAKKSWFVFDDEIVALGSGITSTSGRTIETIVENRGLNSDGDNTLVLDGTTKSTSLSYSESASDVDWIYLEGSGGYVFLDGEDIELLRERREGTSYDINQLVYDPDDDFNSTEQQSSWIFINEDHTYHSLTGTAQRITTQTGTLGGSYNTSKNIMLRDTPKEDFYFTTKLSFLPSENGQEAGLIVYLDEDNYVSLSKIYIDGVTKLRGTKEVNGTKTYNDYTYSFSNDLYLKIEKSDDNYILYASDNGSTWGSAVETFTHTMGGINEDNYNLKMGLFAQNDTSTTGINADYDYFNFKVIKNYVTIWTDHGIDPTDDTYSYVILPKKNSSEVSSYSSNPDVNILRNNSTIQAVKDTTLGIIGATFWSTGTVDYIKSYNPATVMSKEENNEITVSVSDPSQTQSILNIELYRSATTIVEKDESITVLQLYPTIKFTVDVSGNSGEKGKTHTIKFSYEEGNNVAYGASISYSSSYIYSGWEENNVVDGETSSLSSSMGWSSNNTLSSDHTEWITVDLGSEQVINKVDLFPRDDGTNKGYGFPIDFDIMISTDNVNWTIVVSKEDWPMPSSDVQSFCFEDVTARYIKIEGKSLTQNPYDSNLYRMQLAEIEIYRTRNNVAFNQTVTTSSSFESNSSWDMDKITDGIREQTGWSSNNDTSTNHIEWIQIDLGEGKSFSKIELIPRNDDDDTGYGFPIDFIVQVSSNGSDWITVVTQTGYSKPTGEAQVFTFDLQNARYMKVTGTNLRQNPYDSNLYRMQFADIEIYND